MNPSFETDHSIDNAIAVIATLSPKATSSIENESYRQTADSDGSTKEYILEDAFQNLIKDMETLGVVLNVDYSSYVEEMGVLFSFLRFASLLVPNTLYPTIKTDTRIRELIERIVGGDLGEEETYIQIYLSEIAGLDGQPAIHPELTDFIDQLYPLVSQTENFSDYFKNMIQLFHDEQIMIESNHEAHTVYINKIKDIVGRLIDATSLFENDPRYNEMIKLQNMVIKDFLSPVNFHKYAYLFLETIETLPKELIDSFSRKHYYYEISNPWCYAYYSLRRIIIEDDSGIWPLMYCFVYAMSETKFGFTSLGIELRKDYPNRSDENVVLSMYER